MVGCLPQLPHNLCHLFVRPGAIVYLGNSEIGDNTWQIPSMSNVHVCDHVITD